jgi:hypothetical protein
MVFFTIRHYVERTVNSMEQTTRVNSSNLCLRISFLETVGLFAIYPIFKSELQALSKPKK